MKITDLQKTINQFLAGEMLSYKQQLVHINWAVDSINAQLNACFPIFEADDTEYTAIPDKYLRTVLVPCAVWHFYEVDEEGMSQATQFQQDYAQHMFYMLRDYGWQIPDEYCDSDENGSVSVHDPADRLFGPQGIESFEPLTQPIELGW